jgi:hypothetical protein
VVANHVPGVWGGVAHPGTALKLDKPAAACPVCCGTFSTEGPFSRCHGPAAIREELKGKVGGFMQRLGKLAEQVQAYFEHPKVACASLN